MESRAELTGKPDEELMRLCQQGQTEAFEALYFKHRQSVINFAAQMLRNHEDAADVFQDAFKYIFSKIETYTPSAKFSTLLYKVVRNLCIDILRKRRRRHVQQLNPEIDIEDTSSPGEPALDAQEVTRHIHEAMDQIDEAFREVLILRLLHDHSYEQIGEILQCPIGTVKSRLHTGLALLRKALRQKKFMEP